MGKVPASGHKTGDVKSEVMKIFPKLFKGVGRLPGEYKIELKPDTELMHLPARNVSETLREPLKKKSEGMYDLQLIEKAIEATDWCFNLCTLSRQTRASAFVWTHVI